MWRSENIDCLACALVVITVQLVVVRTGSKLSGSDTLC
jgi:hypothetical protein